MDLQKLYLQEIKVPTIKDGIPSSSEALNAFFKSIVVAQAATTQFIDEQKSDSDTLLSATNLLSTSIGSMFSSLTGQLDALTDPNEFLADISSGSYTAGSTANLSRSFNQCTVPIIKEENILTTNDAYGNLTLLNGVTLWYQAENPTPGSWKQIEDAEEVLLGKKPLVINWPGGSAATTVLNLRLDFNFTYKNYKPTVLEFYPIPLFNGQIREVAVRNSVGVGTTGWTAVDLSYLPGYNPPVYSNSFVNQMTPIRVFLPANQSFKSIRIKISLNSASSWGTSKIELKHLEFSTGSYELLVVNPFGDINNITLRGKDVVQLNQLPKTIVGDTATITLSSSDPTTSPVITGAVVTTV